ncbi:MAG: ferrous iron transport protein B [Trueperaceae bacterium]
MPCPRCEGGASTGAEDRPTVAAAPSEAATTWCLVGTPNVGKSSLINAIAGSQLQVGNWSGTTVEVASATTHVHGTPVTLVDLPGAYALAGTSSEEDVVLPALMAHPEALIVNVVDATHLARDLTLTLELTELGRPMVVALNLVEQAAERGVGLAPGALETALGVPVVALPDHRRHGAGRLVDASEGARATPVTIPYPDAIADAAARLAPTVASRWHALATLAAEVTDAPGARAVAATERAALDAAGIDPFLAIAEARHRAAVALATGATLERTRRPDPSERVDRIVLHPVVGPLALVAGLALTFHLTFAVSTPWIDYFGLVQEVLAGWVAALPLPALVASFLSGALIEGVGTVVSFVPVLFVLYVLLGFLENAGILARVAYLADGLMRAIGLPGRAVLPMVLSIGCTVPAVQATRTLEERGDRLRVALALPSISCSARLPVFVLMAAAFVPAYAAVVVTGLYLLGFAVAIASALLFRRLLRTPEGSGAMELPSYRWPPASLVLRLAWVRTRAFLHSAGGPILLVVSAIWLLLEVTLPSGTSLFEVVARALAPLFAPLGLGDWRIVGALIPAAVAKEVAIGSMALTFVGGGEATAPLGFLAGLGALGVGLLEAARDTLTSLWGFGGGEEVDSVLTARLSGALTTAGAMAFMVFLLLYVPCIATLAALRKAFGARWMAFSIVYQTTIAYLLAWGVYALWP